MSALQDAIDRQLPDPELALGRNQRVVTVHVGDKAYAVELEKTGNSVRWVAIGIVRHKPKTAYTSVFA